VLEGLVELELELVLVLVQFLAEGAGGLANAVGVQLLSYSAAHSRAGPSWAGEHNAPSQS
jgi:hypothetical protein